MKSKGGSLLISVCAGTLLTFLGLFGGVWSLAEPFGLSLSPALLRVLFLSALLSGLTYALSDPRPRLLAVALLCAVAALLIWYRWDSFALGVQGIFHKISLGFHQEISGIYYYELPAALGEEALGDCANYVFMVCAPLFALWLGLWLLGRGPVWPAVVSVCALPGLGLFILREPSPASLCALLLFLALTALSRRGYRQSGPLGARRVLAGAVPVVLVMALLAAVFPQSRYLRPDWAEDLRLRAKAGVRSLSDTGAAQAPGTYSFARFGAPSFDGHTVLSVQSDTPQERLLLRGWSSAEYTKYGWQPLSDEALAKLPDFSETGRPWSYPAHAALDSSATGASAQARSIEITDVAAGADSYYYTPYFLTTMYAGAAFHADAYVTRVEGQFRYSFDYLAPEDVPVGAQVGWDGGERYKEPEYRDFVYQYYREVPYALLSDEALEVIRAVAAQGEEAVSGRSWSDERSARVAMAEAVAEALASFTRYDLSTPAQPLGQDFVSYFLTTSHRGYCAHYSTAATLILREMGLPARFVGGYVADLPGGEDPVPIPDENAHAWVEVYVDGFGWQPVDVTPASSASSTGGEAQPTQTAEPSSGPSDAPEVSPSPSPSPDPAPSATPSAAPSGQPEASKAPEAAEGSSPRLTWLFGALGVLAALGAVWLQRRLRLALRRRRWEREDPNAAALERYRYLEAVETRLGLPIPEEARALAQKAAFSQHTLTPAEGQSMAEYARKAAEAVKNAAPGRRLLLRYVWALG